MARLSAEERREQLFEVALREFGEHGFRATTMDDIAGSAGVTKPLVYQHFRSKRALYLELVDSVTKDLLDAIQKATVRADGPRQQVELGFAAYFEMVVSHQAAFQLLYDRDGADDPDVASSLRRVEDAIAEAIDPLIAAGLDAQHRRLLAYAVVGMTEGASRHWIETRARTDDRVSGQDDEAGHGEVGQAGGGIPRREILKAEAARLASRMADLAWAGLRSVHAD
jgi:AcrR family transcriptional regulator